MLRTKGNIIRGCLPYCRTFATQPPKVPLPPLPPLPGKGNESSDAPPSTIDTPSPPPQPTSSGLLDRFASKLRRDIEEMEQRRKEKEAAAGLSLPETAIPKVQKQPGLLSRVDERLQQQRRELEAAQLAKREAGQSSRVSPSLQKRMDEYLDLDANLREREELLKKAFREGYWDDYKEAARKGAKLWEAPRRMRNANASPLVPNPQSRTLAGQTTDVMSLVRNKKASLVTFMFSAFGEPHVNSFADRFLKEFKDVPEVQLVQLNIEENWVKAPVLKMLTPVVRWRVPKDRRDKYLLHYSSIADARRSAGMTNNVLGWVNLVDSQGRIRWQAHGLAKDHELATMIKLTRKLAGLSDVVAPDMMDDVPPDVAQAKKAPSV
ncbi:uncharacterized protein SPPG_02297 [Spizellomyces punctatus DAOM BR117]|uniref:Uncharacterized protein n=1 Tax=Spizellomyces punctatus (strain DAOM BR117) TaxID=645134 RepID=A0A0L0HQY1_SPIPD|nr:uncharacterized protein SPPG_02297 [Spizellomyces punctatus DAOM BR117]KND03244.1 hypothetical protein SPPG_02297 [Spizellomyces punctatus DAOM BR117]|eukprot:XP_016611283.1 hypothetical protein SPPG_02297 [Spizellomyces punctatus DAOM BR117]